MFRWVPYVFVRITLLFITGILWGIYAPDSLKEGLAQILLLFLAVGYGILWYLNRTRHSNIYLSGIGLPLLVLAGYVLVLLRTDSRSELHVINQPYAITYYKATITGYAQEKERSWKVEARVSEVRTKSEWINVEGKVILYFTKKDFERPFAYGDVVLIEGSPQVLAPPANPGEFDYKRFLSFKKIYHQHFLQKEKVRYLYTDPPSFLMQLAIQARVWSIAQINEFVEGEREQAVASALVLGVTDGLDNELLQAYSATGAMHVLAVSGLHVGIIYGILVFLLKPIAKRRGGKWSIAIISFSVLWLYAFVTGLSPSVLRAVTMFSFVALARPLQWSTNIYNTLALSAFCLLVYEPYLIMSVGFQLSYAAVLGIVYWQRPLYQLWEAPHWMLDKIWQITTVSIAAQLATVSLGLLYFHQFPIYFIFSNLLVIPISFAVLLLGLGVLVFALITPLATFLGWLLTGSIQAMNASVTSVEGLPFSLLDNLYITTAQSWLIMLLLVSLALLFQHRRFYYVPLISLFIIGLSATQWIHFHEEVKKTEVIFYGVPGHQAIDFISTGHVSFFADSALPFQEEKMRFHIHPNRLTSEVKTVEILENENTLPLSKSCRLIVWRGKTILIIDEKKPVLPTFKTDFLVISKNAISLQEVLEKINVSQVIVDSSNSFYFAEKLMREAKQGNVPVHSILHQGYFSKRL